MILVLVGTARNRWMAVAAGGLLGTLPLYAMDSWMGLAPGLGEMVLATGAIVAGVLVSLWHRARS